MRRHILPAVAGPALTQISIVAAVACLVEAAIGFLGLGVAPPNPSWGNMVTDAQQAIVLAPWMLVPTGGIIAIVALSADADRKRHPRRLCRAIERLDQGLQLARPHRPSNPRRRSTGRCRGEDRKRRRQS